MPPWEDWMEVQGFELFAFLCALVFVLVLLALFEDPRR